MQKQALAVLLGATLTGGLTQALFGEARVGAGWFVLDVVLVAAMLVAFARDPSGRLRVSVPGAIGVAAIVSLGAAIVWRDSDWALWIAFPVNILLLGALPFVLARGPRLGELGELPRLVLTSIARAPVAFGEWARLPKHALGSGGSSRLGVLARGLAIGLPITAVLVTLLSADKAFASALRTGVTHSGGALRFVAASLCFAATYAFLYTFHRQDERASDDVAPPRAIPYRSPGDLSPDPGSSAHGRLLYPSTFGVVLAQLGAVFALFGAVNARSLFAGHALTRAHGTVTYAQHLHAGFFQVSVATLLAVLTVVAGHALMAGVQVSTPAPRYAFGSLMAGVQVSTPAPRYAFGSLMAGVRVGSLMRPRGPLAGPVPGGAPLAALELTVLALAGVALASSCQRLHIYEVAYGYTYQRLAVTIAQLGVLALLVLTAAKSIARAWSGWPIAVALAGLAIASVAPWFDADGYVARGNVERAARARQGTGDPLAWGELDADYLERLSADAAPVLAHPLIAGDPDLSRRLRWAWADRRAARGRDWRSFRGLGAKLEP